MSVVSFAATNTSGNYSTLGFWCLAGVLIIKQLVLDAFLTKPFRIRGGGGVKFFGALDRFRQLAPADQAHIIALRPVAQES